MSLGWGTGKAMQARSMDTPLLTSNRSRDAAVIALPPVHKSQLPIQTLIVGVIGVLDVLVLRNVYKLLSETRGTRPER